jgi:hypothetical protein
MSLQEALEKASGQVTRSQALEALVSALAIFMVAEGVDPEVVKKGLDYKCSTLTNLLALGQVPGDS